MPPLRPGLLALLLLVPVWTRAQPAPVAAAAPAAAANLKRHPELASDFDRELLLDAGYSLESDGGVLDAKRAPLDEPALKGVLERLRSERKEKTLVDLESLQESFGRNGALSAEQLGRLQKDLRNGWPLIPEDVRGGFNEMLAGAGKDAVAGPNLDWVKSLAKSWERADPGVAIGPDLRMPEPPPEPGLEMLRPKVEPHHLYIDEFSPPSQAVVKARLAEVDRATFRDPATGKLQPYAPDVKQALRAVMRYADPRDGEAALRVLRELHPPIAIGNGTVPPFAGGVSYSPDGENPHDLPHIGLGQSLIGYGYDKKDGSFAILPSGDPAYYKKLGLTPPAEAALDPASKPLKTEKYAYYTQEIFADGSVRQTSTALGLAPTLLHELMHQNTYLIGAGENAFSNEMRSMTAERRLTYNRDEARGLTRDPDYGKDWDWYSRPLDFRRSILASYSSKAVGEVRPGEETVDGQIQAKRALLASGDLKAWRTDAVNNGVNRQRDNDLSSVDVLEKAGLIGQVEAEQARERVAAAAEELRRKRQAEPVDAAALVKGDMSRLEKDREQTLRVFLEDWRWHQERGIGTYEEKTDAQH